MYKLLNVKVGVSDLYNRDWKDCLRLWFIYNVNYKLLKGKDTSVDP